MSASHQLNRAAPIGTDSVRIGGYPERRFPLSESQRGLWVVQRSQPRMIGYNVPVCFRLDGRLDPTLLRLTCVTLLSEHTLLTASIEGISGMPWVRARGPALVPYYHASLPSGHRETAIDFLHRKAREPFDLSANQSLCRIYLISATEWRHYILFVCHHLVFDGSCIPLLRRSLSGTYASLSRGRRKVASGATPSYEEFVAYEREWLACREAHVQRDYWRRALAGITYETALLPDSFRYDPTATQTLEFSLPELLAEQINQWTASNRVRPSVFFLGLYCLLLGSYAKASEVIVGTPTACRHQPRFEGVIGNFANMLALRVRIQPNQPRLDFLRSVQRCLADALDNSAFPFGRVVRDVNPKRSKLHAPLIQVAYVYLRCTPTAAVADEEFDDLSIETLDEFHQEGEYPLVLEIVARTRTYSIRFKHGTDSGGATIQELARLYQRLLTQDSIGCGRASEFAS
jgi:hypothetical protein